MSSIEETFFSRQVLVPEIGTEGQKKWSDSSVLVIGLGGLGCPSVLQLALSGIGRIGLVDFDKVELTNLHRQTLFTHSDIGNFKTEVVSRVISEKCPWIKLEKFTELISDSTDLQLFDSWDIVLDCTDSISSKYLINQYCIQKSIPLVSASVFRTSGQFGIFSKEGKPCYRCLYPNLEEGDLLNCNIGGILGIQATLAGTYQASLALQYLLNPGTTNTDLVYFMEWNPLLLFQSKIIPNPNCPVCSSEKKDYSEKSTNKTNEMSIEDFDQIRNQKNILFLDVRESEETSHSNIDGAISFPLSGLEEGKMPKVADHQMIVCICESGVRSKIALKYFNTKVQKFSIIGGRRAYVNFYQQKS
ncbi:MAG: HesA/MoeB/ThiF family protein [Leptospira sp.]|nr:HesA/MoeB/ThiF family protein [Leptospira sp.]